MAKSPSKISMLERNLKALGLSASGVFKIPAELCPQGQGALADKPAIMIGNSGGEMWEVLRLSPEFSDGLPNPMNRWTEREITALAHDIGVHAIFPFDEPYWPFQRLARIATGIQPSPLGLLVHPRFGLWQALRSVLIFESDAEIVNQFNALEGELNNLIHPCDSCEDKPCLTACPVGAFTGEELKVDLCFGHLDSGADPKCMTLGCRARDACPVGVEHRYDNAQVQFHMRSYRGV